MSGDGEPAPTADDFPIEVSLWVSALHPDEAKATADVDRFVKVTSHTELARIARALEVLRIAVVCERSDRKNRALATPPTDRPKETTP